MRHMKMRLKELGKTNLLEVLDRSTARRCARCRPPCLRGPEIFGGCGLRRLFYRVHVFFLSVPARMFWVKAWRRQLGLVPARGIEAV